MKTTTTETFEYNDDGSTAKKMATVESHEGRLTVTDTFTYNPDGSLAKKSHRRGPLR